MLNTLTEVGVDPIKCKKDLCAGTANESGFCDEHDPHRIVYPSNGISTSIFVIGIITILLGALSFLFLNFSVGIDLIIAGIVFLGFSEVISLLHKIAHINHQKYKEERRSSE